uniref:Uncharacterized protein n=1 Tax=Rhizophagus irregularis (strain DAOM 181602 / DAOM 197198 / MUCL 43194) TaxID=747089 RepID=U9T9B8_RHIID
MDKINVNHFDRKYLEINSSIDYDKKSKINFRFFEWSYTISGYTVLKSKFLPRFLWRAVLVESVLSKVCCILRQVWQVSQQVDFIDNKFELDESSNIMNNVHSLQKYETKKFHEYMQGMIDECKQLRSDVNSAKWISLTELNAFPIKNFSEK